MLAVVTVVYENYTVLEDFFESLTNQKNKSFRLFLVDLSDNKKSIPDVNFSQTVIKASNKGYSFGVNLGIKKALEMGYDIFCVINDDTYFKTDFIESITSSIRKHPNAVVGGKIYYAPGYEYHKDRYAKKNLGKVLWYAGGSVDWNHALTPHRGVDEIDTGQYDTFGETDFINGALMIFDKTVIDKVGFWGEKYFLYFEDADFSVRAKRAGISLYFDPQIVIWHKNSASTGGSGSKLHQKYQDRNRLRFGLKYAPWKTKLHLIKNYIQDKI